MARPESLETERVAMALRSLPRRLKRPAQVKDIAGLFGVSRPTARKYMRLAIDAGLLESQSENTTPEPQTAS